MKKRKVVNWYEVVRSIRKNHPRKLKLIFSELANEKRCGRIMTKTLCPFHKEKTPSLISFRYVFNADHLYSFFCHGCGWEGSIIDYYMKRKGVSFFKAVIDLARIFKIKLEWTNIS